MSSPSPPILLLDGGLGTTLADLHSYAFSSSTPLWSSHLLLSDSDCSTLSSVQTSFVRAGANVLLTATYQASYEGFAKSGVSDEREARRMMRAAVNVARRSFKEREGGESMIKGEETKGLVALSLGAYGATMLPSQEYSGNYDMEHSSISQLRDWHLKRMSTFLPSSVSSPPSMGKGEEDACWDEIDFVAFETLPRLDEILAVRETMANISVMTGIGSKEKPFWISCVFPGEGNALPDGSSIRDAVRAMLIKRENSRTPMAIGINCTKVGKVEGLILEFEAAVAEVLTSESMVENEGMHGTDESGKWPALVVYPDGTNGEVYNTTTKVWEKSEDVGHNKVSSSLFMRVSFLKLELH
jgi:homocysteine S-methyltransferase